jgi:cysteinyl-tRNA synthetase
LDILFEKQTAIHENLCDNFNTPQVIKNLISIISKTYEYEKKTRGTSFKIFLIFNLAQYIAFITKSLGLIYKTEFIEYFIKSSDEGSRENFVTPYVDVITKFRDAIKTIASTEKDYIKILKKCDELRDEVMPALGVKIEDRGKGVVNNINFYILNLKFYFFIK